MSSAALVGGTAYVMGAPEVLLDRCVGMSSDGVEWTTLAEYLRFLEKRGISCNVASFIGATTIRENVIGFEDKAPTPEQLAAMRELVRQEMEAGALGIGTSLIYDLDDIPIHIYYEI